MQRIPESAKAGHLGMGDGFSRCCKMRKEMEMGKKMSESQSYQTEMSTTNKLSAIPTEMSTPNEPQFKSGLSTATEMSALNKPACESGLGTATEISTSSETACKSGLGTAIKMSTFNEPACESGFGTATEMSTPNNPVCESGLGTATEMSTSNEPVCESGLGTTTEMSTSNEPVCESGLGTATEMSTSNEPVCESGLGTTTEMSTSNEPVCESGLGTTTEISTSNKPVCESGLGTTTEMSTPNKQVRESGKRIKAEGFLALCDSEWPEEVSSAALTTPKTAKLNKPSPLPLTEDIAKLQNLLEEKMSSQVMFNRRRGAETEKLTVQSYRQKTRNSATIKDIEHSLTAIEKIMCSLFHRIELRGKTGELVPVILTPDIVEKIDLLLKTRESVGVSAANCYVFARLHCGSTKPIRVSDTIRKYAKISGVERIENLTSTKLRKHIATVSQVMNLKEPELELFLGYDLTIHRSFYRLPESPLQVAKLGKFLLAAESGQIRKYISGTLDDIKLEDDVNVGSPDPPSHSRTFRPNQKGNIKRLTPEQTRTLRTYFRENIELRRNLKRHECLQAINENPCLSDLDWKKVKNTIHNWITLEKRKTFRLATI